MRKRNNYITLFELFLLILLFSTTNSFLTFACHARNVVVPTYYGYGVVSQSGGWVYPYIVHPAFGGYSLAAFGPYNVYFLQGLLPYYFVVPFPNWTGVNWVYPAAIYGIATDNINIRSEPQKTKNIIGMLRTNEPVFVLGEKNNWYYVQPIYNPMLRGFVHKSYIKTVYGYAYGSSHNYCIPNIK